jgi:hypothetical protein
MSLPMLSRVLANYFILKHNDLIIIAQFQADVWPEHTFRVRNVPLVYNKQALNLIFNKYKSSMN